MISTINTTEQQVPSDHSDIDYVKEAKAWLRFGVKIGLGCASTFALSQIAYSYLLSPNHEGNSKETSLTYAFYNRFSNGCPSLAFKSERILFNLFETWAPIYRFFGFKSEPPGDMQGFILDQNQEALECAYPSAEHVSIEAKNRLLAKVLRVMNFEKRDLSDQMKWLVSQGADPKLAVNVDLEDLRHVKEKSLTPLMTAYRVRNISLFQFLLEQGASVSQKVFTFSNKTYRFDQNLPLILALVNDIIRDGVGTARNCPFYKEIVDLSLSNLPTKNDFSSVLNKEELQKTVYRAVKASLCSDTFTIEEVDEEDEVEEILADDDAPAPASSWDQKLAGLWNGAKVYLDATFQAAQEKIKEWAQGHNFFMGSGGSEMTKDEALSILGLQRGATRAQIREAYKKLSLEIHPDKNSAEGAEERFIRVSTAYQTLCRKEDDKKPSNDDSGSEAHFDNSAESPEDIMDRLVNTPDESVKEVDDED